MSDRIVVMRNGIIEQIGSPLEIYNLPRNAFVADFVGSANLITGRLRPDLAGDGMIVLETPSGHIVHGMAHGRAPGAEPTLSVRTVHLGLTTPRRRPARTSGRSPSGARLFQGDFTQVLVAWGDRELVVRCAAFAPLRDGTQAYLAVSPEHCVLLEG